MKISFVLILVAALTPMAFSRRIQAKVATVVATEKNAQDNQDTASLDTSTDQAEDETASQTEAKDSALLDLSTVEFSETEVAFICSGLWKLIRKTKNPRSGWGYVLRKVVAWGRCPDEEKIAKEKAAKKIAAAKAKKAAELKAKEDDLKGGRYGFKPGSTIALNHGTGCAFSSRHRQWCTDEGNAIKCTSQGIGRLQKFQVVDAGAGMIALKGGKHGKYCSAAGDKYIKCNRDAIGASEKFQVVDESRKKDIGLPCKQFSGASCKNNAVKHMTKGSGRIALKGGPQHKFCGQSIFLTKMSSTRSAQRVQCNSASITGDQEYCVKCLSGCPIRYTKVTTGECTDATVIRTLEDCQAAITEAWGETNPIVHTVESHSYAAGCFKNAAGYPSNPYFFNDLFTNDTWKTDSGKCTGDPGYAACVCKA